MSIGDFFKAHWHRVLMLAVGAIFGYMGGVLGTHSDISNLRERTARLEANGSATYGPAATTAASLKGSVSDNTSRLNELKKEVGFMAKSMELSDKLARIQIEQVKLELGAVRKETITELRGWLDEVKKK